MQTRSYLSLCLVAGVVALGIGSAASWLPGRTATATSVDGAVAVAALPELVPAAPDGTARWILGWLSARESRLSGRAGR